MRVENVNIATPFNKEFVTGSEFERLEILEHQDVNIVNGKIESITPTSNPKKRSYGRFQHSRIPTPMLFSAGLGRTR